jgi:hypothetical protein
MHIGGLRATGLRAAAEPIAPWAGVLCAFAGGALLAWWVARLLEERRPEQLGPVDDDTLRERVRVRVAGVVSRPEAVEISVQEGVVRLSGEVAPEERDTLLAELVTVPGVYRVRNALAAPQAARDARGADAL